LEVEKLIEVVSVGTMSSEFIQNILVIKIKIIIIKESDFKELWKIYKDCIIWNDDIN